MTQPALLLTLAIFFVACGAVPEPAATAPTGTAEAPPPGPIPTYDRDEWHHWIDADHDRQDTRQEVLIAESAVPVTFEDARKCRVTTGQWTCPYTGDVYTDPGLLDIDHMVPLENAHVSGGWAWDAAKKELYANDLDDPEHIVAVYRSANRSKGSKGPEEWMPPDEPDWCDYVDDWKTIKERWGLSMNDDEAEKVAEVMEGCGQ